MLFKHRSEEGIWRYQMEGYHMHTKDNGILTTLHQNHLQLYIHWIIFCPGRSNPHPYFKNQVGIRQGHPLSLILFDLIMDVLTRLIENKVEQKKIWHHVDGTT